MTVFNRIPTTSTVSPRLVTTTNWGERTHLLQMTTNPFFRGQGEVFLPAGCGQSLLEQPEAVAPTGQGYHVSRDWTRGLGCPRRVVLGVTPG
jgi:hypothetical protein